jgi:adenylate cyclase, class 2
LVEALGNDRRNCYADHRALHTNMQNIELKARLKDLERARQIAAEVATEQLPAEHQIDTYFCCNHGRLKLREINARTAHLISYERPDLQGPKASLYRLVPVSDPTALKAALASALGVWTIVEKRREIWLRHNVRIHVDEVTGLGGFIEFEAVLKDGVDSAAGHAQVEELTHRFGIHSDDLLSGSYADMLR